MLAACVLLARPSIAYDYGAALAKSVLFYEAQVSREVGLGWPPRPPTTLPDPYTTDVGHTEVRQTAEQSARKVEGRHGAERRKRQWRGPGGWVVRRRRL